MIDLKLFREKPDYFEQKAKEKGVSINSKSLSELETKHRELQQKDQELRTERNQAAKDKNIEKGKQIKKQLQSIGEELKNIEEKLQKKLFDIPNPSKDDVKVGKDDTENEILRKHGEPTLFDFKPKDHVELGELLDIIDIPRAAKVSGARFTYLKNQATILELALVRFAFDTLTQEGFTPVFPPALIKQETMQKLGYMEHGGDEDMFTLEKDGYVLIATAEHALIPMHMDELLNKKDLPLRYVGFSPSFRREAGSYGKDTRGILRVHQFDKVEMVSFVEHDKDDEEHDYLLSIEEKLFQALEIPYQVVKMCTGDLGFPAARKYDLEAWMPSQNKYREVTSVSTVTDFQARRLNTRYQNGQEKEYVSMLNGTAFAIGRTLIAILENFQQKDGTVVIPKALQKYTGFDKISPVNS